MTRHNFPTREAAEQAFENAMADAVLYRIVLELVVTTKPLHTEEVTLPLGDKYQISLYGGQRKYLLVTLISPGQQTTVSAHHYGEWCQHWLNTLITNEEASAFRAAADRLHAFVEQQ